MKNPQITALIVHCGLIHKFMRDASVYDAFRRLFGIFSLSGINFVRFCTILYESEPNAERNRYNISIYARMNLLEFST